MAEPVRCAVVSTSLRSGGVSRVLALAAADRLRERGAAVEFIDLLELALPLCDDDACWEHPNTKRLGELLDPARGILIALPVYNYAAGAAAKNIIELAGSSFEGKAAGFLCAAGGHRSYMSVMGLANSLMLDFRTVIVPRFVYATGQDVAGGQVASLELQDRIDGLALDLLRLAAAVTP